MFAFVVLGSSAALGSFGFRIASEAPPVPTDVYAGDRLLFEGDLIRKGQNVWQSLGGMEIGSVWGHGAYVAPDWSADWLHRELVFMLDRWAKEEGAAEYDALPAERQAALRERLRRLSKVRAWVGGYRWAIYFFVAVAFWNMVGAGLFGFMINPPIALYYMQGLNTTPGPRPHGALRCLRHAGAGTDALLRTRPDARQAVAHRRDQV